MENRGEAMRSIGIPVANREECVVALEVAFKLGKALNSDVVGYHMRPNRKEAATIDFSALLASSSTAWPVVDEKTAQEAAVSAQKLFAEMASQYDYELSTKRGSPE